MGDWTKILRDCSIHLDNAINNYLEPDLFRINFNNFMQTARTVTFLIQKEKSTLQQKIEFDTWYQSYQTIWKADSVMRWSVDTRNIIEKQSDIPIYSKLEVKLALGYRSKEDIHLKIQQDDLVFLGIKGLRNWAKKHLDQYNYKDSAIWIGRSWKEPKLENMDLVSAMQYVYARLYECCIDLNHKIDENNNFTIKTPDEVLSEFNITHTYQYIELTNFESISFKTKTYKNEINFSRENFLEERPYRGGKLSVELKNEFSRIFTQFNTVLTKQELLDIHSDLNLLNFQCDGSILQFVAFFDEKFKCIKYIPYMLPVQLAKYIFWRNIGAFVSVLKPKYIIFSDEYYIRDMPQAMQYWRNTKIQGEYLSTRLLSKIEDDKFELLEIRHSIENEKLLEPIKKEISSLLLDINANNEAFMYVPILKEL